MKLEGSQILTSPTDLANFVACPHKSALDLAVAEGRLERPVWTDPLAEVLRRRGEEHERSHVAQLRAAGLTVVDLSDVPRERRAAETESTMRAGADAIVQAALTRHSWLGYADVLVKVAEPSALGDWSYEVEDTKLTRETRGGTILQLTVYSEVAGQIQGRPPERFHVVTPARTETYRVDDFGAFYRQAKARFVQFVSGRRGQPALTTHPEPVEHCGVCRWASRCTRQLRDDDHLSFVAGMGRSQRSELKRQGVATMAALAAMPVPLTFKPKRGASETYERLREQARLQVQQRESGQVVYELLPIEENFGLTQLPEPRPGDFFLDLEGDMFGRPGAPVEAGDTAREYLFGLGRVGDDGRFTYQARWAFNDVDERSAFEAVMDDIMGGLDTDPSVHVYHYAAYEPSAFKRLAGRYATREADLDRLLRGGRFVDLYSVVRHAVRAGVESYSIKAIEPFYTFVRDVALDDAGTERHQVEAALETGDLSLITATMRGAVEGYNRDDCRSTLELRRWLESLRQSRIDAGETIARPPLEPDEPSEKVSERQQRINCLRARLLDGVPTEPADQTSDQHVRHLVAYMLDWHYREDKVTWWEYFRLLGLSDEELLDEPDAVAGLEFVERVDLVRNMKTGKPTGSVVDRYRYPLQECDIRRGQTLKLRDEKPFGEVVSIDRIARTIDIKKGKSRAELHPSSAFAHEYFNPEEIAGSLFRLGERIADSGVDSAPAAARDLLLRRTSHGVDDGPGTLAIQGPPGSGKTYTGAQMIADLVAKGKRVGVTATGHKVIRNLLDEVARRAPSVRPGHKLHESPEQSTSGVQEFTDNDEALDAVANGTVQVLGATAFFWGREDAAGSVDVLFIDEAGQMSLANALAVSQAAPNVVLLGDPQQLEQPQKGSHPDGIGVSALEHVLDGHQTIPPDRGIFLPETYRLPPRICEYTSEVFYDGRLTAKAGLERQRLAGTGRFDGAGLFYVEAVHDGCRNSSDEEVALVTAIVGDLLAPDARWVDKDGLERQMTTADIRVMAPYNAQVARLQESLPAGVPVGTVDKFQGQEAPVAIYSMATSRPEDAPRGMEFLYNLNRLNVATSRARCACILVANPRLFEPDCKTPRQMRLANALARAGEFARVRAI
jgi:uncharacterized protein